MRKTGVVLPTVRGRARPRTEGGDLMIALERAERYVEAIPPAVAGASGHDQTFSTACSLVRNFGDELDEAGLLEVLQGWNSTCDPPWSDRDLNHKLRDAMHRVTPEQKDERPTRERESWPALCDGTTVELEKLSQLRGYSIESLHLATERGFLKFARWRDRLSWFVCDLKTAPDVCEGRRLDGQRWNHGGKTWTVIKQPGAAKRALGLSAIRDRDLVVMSEGSADWLAGIDLAHRGLADDFSVVTVLGATYWLDDFTVEALAEKSIAVFSDQDPAGQKALHKWGSQLTKAGCRVFDGWSLSLFRNFRGDLNDYLIQIS
jgi:hypothetical protein